ncbi:MAG: adenine deaminase [Clostridia bacterium]|nr:adenine deaminase [Clostridia bacterium]
MQATDLSRLIVAARDGDATLVIKNARVINVFTNEITEADVAVNGDTIIGVGSFSGKQEYDAAGAYLAPGFIDAHVHIESSMVTPASFARVILPKGTTTIIADPHEIANVAGTVGLEAIYRQSADLPLQVLFMLPSCVPATPFEHSGACLTAVDFIPFMQKKSRVLGLGEVMDYVSTVNADPQLVEKLKLFFNRPIDGHAPLLSGRDLNAYCIAGPRTDHECSNFAELKEKLRNGMAVLIRIGSAANGVQEMLDGIVSERLPTDTICFCTDDKHIENILREGHINYIVNTAIRSGIAPIEAIRMATLNTARTFGLSRTGAIAPGYRADMILFDNLADVQPEAVFTCGELYRPSESLKGRPVPEEVYDTVHPAPVSLASFRLPIRSNPTPVIETVPGQLVTKLVTRTVDVDADGLFVPNGTQNKLAVIERHHATGNIGLGIVEGLHIHGGAVASTVAHDSHNIVVAGDNDADMLLAVQTLIDCHGGYCVIRGGEVAACLPLPIGGLMTDAPIDEVLQGQRDLLEAARALGCRDESDPLVLLSFLALPVIPEARLTDMGLFDVTKMAFVQ